jgi:hypothetical protein
LRTAANPFNARIEDLFGGQALDRVDASLQEPPGALTPAGSQAAEGPLVSISMIVDDVAEAVEPCLRSILQQTYPRWELIVRVCPGAGRLASALAVDDVRVGVPFLPSPDATRARNGGLKAANGELIAYLDPPNLWHPQFLETLVAALVGDRARYAVVSDHFDAAQAGQTASLPGPADPHADYAELVGQGAVELNAVVHRRELYDEIGGVAKDTRVGSDRDLLSKYLFVREPGRIESPLMLRQRPAAPACSTGPQPLNAAQLRASAEHHFRDRLPRRPERPRPTLTVVGATGEWAHEKAWDLVAAVSTATSVQLISVHFGDAPSYNPRFLPTVETEPVRLEAGPFPRWASSLARGVANVHGDVAYAAEPRLPSLGLALLASYHHGTPVIADLSHPPMIEREGVGSRSTWDEPLGLDDVDPSDTALLDPHSPAWDRLMAGLARSLPARAVETFAPGDATAPRSLVVHHPKLVVHHPKDETVFDPRLYDRDLARHRLGLSQRDCVVLCGSPQAKGCDGDHPSGVLNDVATRFRVLMLDAGAVSEFDVGGNPQLVDRADEKRVAAALAASDAVLLWLDPETAQPPHALPPELSSALAMQVPVIANDVGELGVLGRSGHVRLVPFGDVDALAATVDELGDAEHLDVQTAGARHLFMRQLSYAAARVDLSVTSRLVDRDGDVRQPAEDFARFFAAFYRHVSEGGQRSR